MASALPPRPLGLTPFCESLSLFTLPCESELSRAKLFFLPIGIAVLPYPWAALDPGADAVYLEYN
jgi:hypothetical protein